jgi:hypothetical protein
VQEEDCLRTEVGERKQVVYIYLFFCLGPFVPVAAAPPGAMEDAFARSVSEVLSFFNVDPARGLDDLQVAENRSLYGANGTVFFVF